MSNRAEWILIGVALLCCVALILLLHMPPEHLIGNGVPSEPCSVGSSYMDLDTGELYECAPRWIDKDPHAKEKQPESH